MPFLSSLPTRHRSISRKGVTIPILIVLALLCIFNFHELDDFTTTTALRLASSEKGIIKFHDSSDTVIRSAPLVVSEGSKEGNNDSSSSSTPTSTNDTKINRSNSTIDTVNTEEQQALAEAEIDRVKTTPAATGASNSATGSLFDNKRFRAFSGRRDIISKQQQSPPVKKKTKDCKRWGVVTTIFDPTEAIVRVANLPSWCLVIVPDLKTPPHYMDKLSKLQSEVDRRGSKKTARTGNLRKEDNLANVFYFDVEDQKRWEQLEGPFGSFVKSTPWKHFCRKNLGYLFAILHGADFVFDFDDDNFIKLDSDGYPVEILPVGKDMIEMELEDVQVVMQGANAFNHHPIMGASIESSWARGFPIELIQDEHSQGKLAYNTSLPFSSGGKQIAVIQFLADGNPDIDAIHRITKPLPMTFEYNAKSVLVPTHAYAPYNAQATIHTKNAFWAMLLPGTVPGRVSDIWRSYFAQCIFADTGLQLVFSPPKVVQERNAHNYLGDLSAERDLYDKSGKLIEFLSAWDSDHDNIPERMEQLWIDLYERGYIEVDDVYAVQMWLGALVQAGYTFPTIKRRFRNVAVMGQFNYADSPSVVNDVIYWTQKTRERFDTVVAAGPFSDEQMKLFEENSVHAISNHIDGPDSGYAGFFSPLDNLKNVLLSFSASSKIEGVLYTHDDGILNVTEISRGEYPFPTQDIIATTYSSSEIEFVDIRRLKDKNKERAKKRSYRIFADGHTETSDKYRSFGSLDEMYSKYLDTAWGHTPLGHCGGGQTELARDPASAMFREQDGSILFSPRVQADFMFVPTKYAGHFARAAELHLKHRIWIECAFGTVVDMVRQQADASVRGVKLCSDWTDNRGTDEMIEKNCVGDQTPAMGFIHPVKISKGYKHFSEVYETLQ